MDPFINLVWPVALPVASRTVGIRNQSQSGRPVIGTSQSCDRCVGLLSTTSDSKHSIARSHSEVASRGLATSLHDLEVVLSHVPA